MIIIWPCWMNIINCVIIEMDFSPSVYEHAAKLIDKTPWSVSRSVDLLYQAHATAFQRYRHSPITVGIDIYNLEVEAYGGVIDEPEGDGVPAISTHPYSAVSDLLEIKHLNPATDGRIPMIISTTQKVASELPDVDVRIPISGPFSIVSNLVGFDSLLIESVINPELVAKALDHIVAGQIAFCNECAKQNLKISLFEHFII